MKLLLIGVNTKRHSIAQLKKEGVQVTSLDRMPTQLPPGTFDVIVLAARDLKELSKALSLRAHYERSWIVGLVPAALILKTDPIPSALDDILSDELWPRALELSLRHYLKQRGLQETIDSLALTLTTQQADHAALSGRSTKLIDQIESNIELATQIQGALLPKVVGEVPGISINAKYFPALGKGADYYDLLELGNKKRIGVILADSKSHQMAASLLSALLKVSVADAHKRFPDSPSFFQFIHEEISTLPRNDPSPPLALFFGILDRSTLSFRYTHTGHLVPLLWRQKRFLPLPPLATSGHGNQFSEHAVQLEPGDFLLMHTDGLKCIASQKAPLQNTLAKILNKETPGLNPVRVRNDLMALIDAAKGDGLQKDDITVIQLSVEKHVLYMPREQSS